VEVLNFLVRLGGAIFETKLGILHKYVSLCIFQKSTPKMHPRLSFRSLQSCEKKVWALGKFLLAHLRKRTHSRFAV
jgi:hypothetical protein